MRKKCVRWAKPVLITLFASAAIVIAWSSAPLLAQSTSPSTQPRLAFADFSYVGGFRLPAESSNGDSFSFGGRQLTYNPVNNSLFVGSREGRIAEVSIPTPVSSNNPTAMPFASFLQPLTDPTEGHLGEIASLGVNLDGLMVYNNRLYGSASIFYDANGTQRVSHYSRSLNLAERSFSGWSSVWDATKTGFVSGMMSLIPVEWRSILGGPAATGQCCIPIVMRTSWGPAAFAFNPDQIGQATVPASPLLYYPNDHPTLGIWEATNPTYGATIQMGGMAIIAGTRTALYLGRNGVGPYCYGNGTADKSLDGTVGPDGAHWCYDPTSSDKGQHAYPYHYQIWAYDLNDFAAVKAGTKQPWEVVPYGVWPFELPTPEASVRMGGIGYDAANQLLYVSQLYADRDGYSYRPVIHVLRVNATPGTNDSSLTQPSGDQTTTAPTTSTTPPANSSTVVSAITLAVNRVAPQMPGTAITFTAFAVGGVEPQEYKWLIDDGTGFKAVTGWSVVDSFTWTPATANARYRVGVWARSNGNTADAPEASASTAFAIATPTPIPVNWVTIAANKTAPQAPGTAITWTATVSGGRNVEYKWLLHDGGSWAPITGWSSSNTFTWTPAIANPNYRIGIWVRSNGNTNDQGEVTSSNDFPIAATVTTAPVAPPLTGVTITTNKVAPQTAGTTIVATATVSGGAAPYTFRWLIHDGTQWNVVTGWTTSNTFSWTPTKADPNYRIGVWVRSAGNTNDAYEISNSLLFSIK